jgi:pyruvate kinase
MTKIVGTLGPKSRSVDTISACLKAGMSGNKRYLHRRFKLIYFRFFSFFLSCCDRGGALSVARFDFSWGDAAYHQETLENLKLAIKSTKKLCAVSYAASSLN